MHQLGALQFPKPDDEEFVDYFDAINKAAELSTDDSIYAVWEKDSGDLEAIIYQGEVFEKD